MNKNCLLIICFLLNFPAFAQHKVRFTDALTVSSGSRYGREAIYTDLLAWKLYNGTLARPVEGGEFGLNDRGDKLLWRAIKADTSGRFRAFLRNTGSGPSNNPFLNPGSVDRGADYIYLTYNSDHEQAAVVHILGNSGLYVNGAPHMGDPYSSGYLYVPVKLKKGLNEFYVRGANILPGLIFPARPLMLNTDDPTLPHVVPGLQDGVQKGALVLVNTSAEAYKGLQARTSLNGRQRTVAIADIPAMGSRKIIFELDGSGITAKGKYDLQVEILERGKVLDAKTVTIEAVEPGSPYSSTFVSAIDGSLQYYAVTPQLNGHQPGSALFLSVHGAGVEAIGQARAYKSKDWGTLVAATNRRPRGFNWEDWGRLDALEVLGLARQRFQPDEQRIYLTGHSMGGHGTWFLGATYPDKWAAIAPAAGYPTLKEYGSADGKIPGNSAVPAEQMLLRAGNQSDVPKLAMNYRQLGVYILHGDADRVVPVSYARQMREVLAGFHPDYSYYEYPGGEHWFGDQSVDWPPMFSYFKWHSRLPDSLANTIDFSTSSPGISSSYRWAGIIRQEHPLQYSRIRLNRDLKAGKISGATDNAALLKLALNQFGANATLTIRLDSLNILSYTTRTAADSIYLMRRGAEWVLASKPAATEKNPARYGTFKEAFNHNMLFVVGTGGSAAEREANRNKAVYDAESWYYRGNGAVDIITDKEYAAAKYAGRNVILYGNASNNAAWKLLLADCPIQVSSGQVKAGDRQWSGDDLAAYFVWPQKDPKLLTGVVAGSGVKGMKAAYANQYFAGGSGFPDFMVFTADMLKEGSKAIKLTGFFDHQWKLAEGEMAAGKQEK